MNEDDRRDLGYEVSRWWALHAVSQGASVEEVRNIYFRVQRVVFYQMCIDSLIPSVRRDLEDWGLETYIEAPVFDGMHLWLENTFNEDMYGTSFLDYAVWMCLDEAINLPVRLNHGADYRVSKLADLGISEWGVWNEHIEWGTSAGFFLFLG